MDEWKINSRLPGLFNQKILMVVAFILLSKTLISHLKCMWQIRIFEFLFIFTLVCTGTPLQTWKILNLFPALDYRHAAGTHMLHMKCFHASQMAAAALQPRPASPHLACISSHILSSGMLLGYHAWLGAEKWGQRATA